MAATRISLDEAFTVASTGDVWVFRGKSLPDRAIQFGTNSPVNHVGMTLAIDDLPPMMWHAELGRSLRDVWSNTHHRGAQLHDLRAAVQTWVHRYRQRAWLRQLDPPATRKMEDAALRTVARLDGMPFPSNAQLAWRWLRARAPQLRGGPWLPSGQRLRGGQRMLETAYCAEIVAMTYEAMGLLPVADGAAERPASWYDPGRPRAGRPRGAPGPRRRHRQH